MGKSSLGFEQLSGLSRVANPPARIRPFKRVPNQPLQHRGKNAVIAFTRGQIAPLRIDVPTARLRRKGVEAIFSTPGKRVNTQFVVGLLVLLIGIILCVAVGLESQFPRLLGAPEIGLYLAVLLSSLGLCLVVVGGGICLSYSMSSSSVKDNDPLDHYDATFQDIRKGPDRSVRMMKGDRDVRGTVFTTQNVAFAAIAFLQSCVVLALYSGLADEYQSSFGMRLWIRSNFPLGGYFLNWPTALIVAAVLGLVVVQFLPGKRFAQ